MTLTITEAVGQIRPALGMQRLDDIDGQIESFFHREIAEHAQPKRLVRAVARLADGNQSLAFAIAEALPDLRLGQVVDGLEVGPDGESLVTEIDVDTFTVRRTVVLPDEGERPTYARDVAFLPGDATAFAVTLRRTNLSPDYGGVILVDDGLATGSTMRAAAESLRQRGPRSIVAAVPVGDPDAKPVHLQGTKPRRVPPDKTFEL